jgi:hypothetical protein
MAAFHGYPPEIRKRYERIANGEETRIYPPRKDSENSLKSEDTADFTEENEENDNNEDDLEY